MLGPRAPHLTTHPLCIRRHVCCALLRGFVIIFLVFLRLANFPQEFSISVFVFLQIFRFCFSPNMCVISFAVALTVWVSCFAFNSPSQRQGEYVCACMCVLAFVIVAWHGVQGPQVGFEWNCFSLFCLAICTHFHFRDNFLFLTKALATHMPHNNSTL